MGQRHWTRAIPAWLALALLYLLLAPAQSTMAQGTAVFSRIDVGGNERIEF